MFLIRVNLNKDVYKNYMYAVLWILYVVMKTTTYAMYRYLFICCAIFQLAFLTWYRCSPLSSLCCVAHNMVPLGIACWMNEKTQKQNKTKTHSHQNLFWRQKSNKNLITNIHVLCHQNWTSTPAPQCTVHALHAYGLD